MVTVIAGLSSAFLSPLKAESSAVVWTDKKEYYPDEIAKVFGYGFNPFSEVTVNVTRPDGVVDTVYAFTDEFGYFVCEYQLDGIHGTFNVTATDGTNFAETNFGNCLHLRVRWRSHCCWYIVAKAIALKPWKSYYVKYFDPNGIMRRKSPTFSGFIYFKDFYTITPNLTDVIGWWTVKLYENDVVRRVKRVYVYAMVWTTDSTYQNLVTSYYQGDTLYYKVVGLDSCKYYRLMLESPSNVKTYITDWQTGITSLTGSYSIPANAETGSWKLHVREAFDASGTCEHHYVDTCYFEIKSAPPPPQYYLTVQTDPPGIVTIPGEGWYLAGTYVNLTAPDFVNGPTNDTRYRFEYWDVDGVSQGVGVNPITVFMDANHTATAHYVLQYYLNVTSNPPSVTTPAGSGWYDEGANASIFAPTYVSIVAGASRYRFVNWTTADMSEIENYTSPSTTVYMDKPKTVVANYVVQYKVTFNQTGVGADFTGAVVNVDGDDYGVSDLPVSFWWDEGSTHNFMFYSPLTVTPNAKRYVWTSTTGLSNQQSDTITVTTNGNITGNYKTQFYLDLETSPSGVTTPAGEGWYDEGTFASISTDQYVDIVPDSSRYRFVNWTTADMSEISDPNSPSTTVLIDKAKTVTANYVVQYKVSFDQTGLDNTAIGTIVTVDGNSKTFAELPFIFWADEGTVISYSYESTISSSIADKRFVLVDVSGPASPFTVTSSISVVGNYKTQFRITFDQTGIGGDYAGTVINIDGTDYGVGNLPVSFWWDENSAHNFEFYSPLVVSTDKRYIWVSTSGLSTQQSGTLTVTSSGDIVGNYATQYKVIFDHTGLDSTATGTVVTVNGSPKTFSDLPFEMWVNESTTITYSYENLVSSTTPDKRFYLTSITGPASPFTVTASVTITGNYIIQYKITFNQSGVGIDFANTIVNIDGNNYTLADLPVSFWWNESSTHNFSFYSPLTVTPNAKRYVWVSTTGLSNQQSGTITVTTSGSITGNYKTQYYLTVNSPYGDPTPTSGWFDANSTITASVTSPWAGPPGTRYVCTGWSGTGSVPASGTTTSVTFTINEPSSITWNWITQYYLTVQTDPPGIVTIPGEGWYNESEDVTLNAPAVPDYTFEYWDVDGVSQGAGVNPITVHMDAPHTATAHYSPVQYYTLTITTTTGGTTDPAPGTYSYANCSYVTVEALPDANYIFDHWELDGVDVGDANPITIHMDSNHTLHAVFTYVPPLTVSISPSSATIEPYESVTFTSDVSGGTPPYSYQWYLDGNPVPGANEPTWTFTPTSPGVYYVYLVVTDQNMVQAQSSTARIDVPPSVVGGKVEPVIIHNQPSPDSSLLAFTLIIAAVVASLGSMIVRKKVRKKS